MNFNAAQKLILITSLILMTSSHPVIESAPVKPKINESSLNLESLSVEQFLSLSKKEFKDMYGGNFSFKHALAFKSLQNEMRKSLRLNQISAEDKLNFIQAAEERVFKFNIGGFVCGFLLGLIGVGLAHIFSTDKDFRRSSWQGLGAWVILLLVLVVV